MTVDTYNQKGEVIGQTRLPKEIFGVKLNPDLVHQAVIVQEANRRKKTAKTKNRGEVRGGGRKPWRQKGTGRARHGSIRSPLWAGGGVTFGPVAEKVFERNIPKKMRRKALFMILSVKAQNNLLFVLDDIKIENPKTKLMAEIFKDILKERKGTCLLALNKMEKNVILSARNIPEKAVLQAKDLNVLDLLSYKYLIITKPGIKVLEETFLKAGIKNED